MQTKFKIAFAAAGILAVGATAGIAKSEMGRHMGGAHGGMAHMMGQMTERYDTNKDGKISQAEIDAERTARLGEFDADKNGTLSLDEFKGLWLKANQERMVRDFQEFDKDGNAQVTLDEYKAPLAQVVSRLDANNDGVLSKDDRPARHGKRPNMMHGNDGERDGEADAQ